MKIDMNDANQPHGSSTRPRRQATRSIFLTLSARRRPHAARLPSRARSSAQPAVAIRKGWRLYFQPKHRGRTALARLRPATHHRCGFGSKHPPYCFDVLQDKPKPKYVKVWKATESRAAAAGARARHTAPWASGPHSRLLDYGSVGYCELGKNCGGFFTDAQMQKKNGQRKGSCTIDVVTTARCTSNNCKAPTPTAKITDLCSAPGPAGNQTPKTSCSAMSSPDSMSCSGEAFILSRPDKYCKGTKTCGVKTEAECRKLCGDAGAQCAGFSNYCSIGHPNCVKGLNGCRCHRGSCKSVAEAAQLGSPSHLRARKTLTTWTQDFFAFA